MNDDAFSFNSGAPWHICMDVKWVGPDLLCRVHGGAEHVGAVALGQWDGRCSHVDTLPVGPHKEGPLATFVARKLCRASQGTVTCLAGIHFDRISKTDIEEICGEVHTLTARAVRRLEGPRMARAGLHSA